MECRRRRSTRILHTAAASSNSRHNKCNIHRHHHSPDDKLHRALDRAAQAAQHRRDRHCTCHRSSQSPDRPTDLEKRCRRRRRRRRRRLILLLRLLLLSRGIAVAAGGGQLRKVAQVGRHDWKSAAAAAAARSSRLGPHPTDSPKETEDRRRRCGLRRKKQNKTKK